MGVRPFPLEYGRYWDATVNVVGGCVIADRSCSFCYAAPYAGGIHAATDIELYRGTVEWRNGRWTWTGLLTKLPRGHPNHTLPLRWRGVEEPLMGPGNPSTLWLNSSRRRSRESDATPPDRPRTLAARTPGQGICEAPCSTASPSARRRSAPHSSQRRRRPASRHGPLRPDGLARTDHRAARPTRRRRPCRRG